MIEDVLYLIEDMAKGSIPFETDSVVEGEVGISFIQIPIKVCISFLNSVFGHFMDFDMSKIEVKPVIVFSS